MRILLIEDDKSLSRDMAAALRSEKFAVDVARNGVDAKLRGESETYDAAILDLGLPELDGVSVLKAWRDRGRRLPVLILTARDGWSDKVAGFKAGADDYLTKPFRMEEVIMRLRALIRRASGHAASQIVCGDLTFDSQLGIFERDGLPLKLTALEWRVLSCLMLRRDLVVERATLLAHCYDGDAGYETNSLEVIIARLRKKLGNARIETVRGRGYRLTADPPCG